MSQRKKVYVTSGDLAVCLVANGPIDAISRALTRNSNSRTIDGDFFFVDERGHRTGDDAQYKIPVEQALAEAGYFFDDPSGSQSAGG